MDLDLRIDSRGSIARAERELGALPDGIARARRRALRKLMTWLSRHVLRTVSGATAITQRTLKTLMRVQDSLTEDGITIWIGTNPIPAHRLGTIRWTRRMQGARAGRRLFPGTWSWPAARRTAGLVMERTGRFGRRNNPALERIDRVDVPIDTQVRRAIDGLMPEIEQRYQTLMLQELRYQLLRERGEI